MSIRSLIPLIGSVVAERYEIVELIGEGGMGFVFGARDAVLGRDVALKIMRPSVAARPDSRNRFEREAKVSAALDHPNAVKIFDFGADGDSLYLAMERLRGESLADRLNREGRQSVARSCEAILSVVEVLVVAHRTGLVHRDIKPANIFLSSGETKRVVVVDFGMAFLEEPEDPIAGRLTTEGIGGGTPAYMSPEQCCNQEIGPPSDIYALGCVLFETLCNEAPFDDMPVAKMLVAHMYGTPRKLGEIRPEAPRALGELIARMLAKKPIDRPTADAVGTRLKAILEVIEVGGRERSRDATYLSTRADRAIPRPTPMPMMETRPKDSIAVAIVGPVSENLKLGLSATGFIPTFHSEVPPNGDDIDLVYLIGGGVEAAVLAVVAEVGPVVVGATVSIDETRELIRVGVAEIVNRPDNVAMVASKLRRAYKKALRRKE